jgi:hypothetical protein
MLLIDKLSVTETALARIGLEVARLKPRASDVMVLSYMSRFVNADGTTVRGFSPGYTIEFEPKHDGGDIWAKARLPDGTELYFIPRFRSASACVMDVASSYTLSIEPAAP